MENPRERTGEHPEEAEEPTTADKLLSSPDIQKGLAQIPDLIRSNIEAKTSLAKAQLEAQTGTIRGSTKWILLWGIALTLVIIAPVAILTYFDKISSDAATFVFGTIVGAAFTFLRNFFPRGN